MNYLLGETNIDIPEEYYQSKYKLMKSPVYGDIVRIKKKQEAIEELYEKYIEILPEDELLAIDIIERTLNFIAEGEGEDLVEIVFEDYLNQVLKKEQYTLNDLLLIKYYSVQCQSSSYDESMIENFRKKLIKQRLQGDELTNVELLGALSAIAGIYVMHHEYEHMKSLVDKMYEIIHSIMQHSYQPGITMLEAKYYLYYEKNKKKAKELYRLAIILAESFGDEVLIKNLKIEKDKDLKQESPE